MFKKLTDIFKKKTSADVDESNPEHDDGFIAFLSQLTHEQKEKLNLSEQSLQLAPGEVLIQEGDKSDFIYYIEKGYAEVTSTTNSKKHQLNQVGPGELVGEISLIDEDKRSATVTALTPLYLRAYLIKDIIHEVDLYAEFNRYIANLLSKRLRETNDLAIQAISDRIVQASETNILNYLMIVIFWLMSLYSISLSVLSHFKLSFHTTHLTSGIFLAVATLMVWALILASKCPLSQFGLSWTNWRSHTVAALISTLPLILLWSLFKWLMITYVPKYAEHEFFSVTSLYQYQGHFSLSTYFSAMVVYSVFVLMMEFVVRVGFQSSLYMSLVASESRKKWFSILLPNLFFSMFHSHISLLVSFLAFLPSLFWGWLFHHHRSYISVCASHLLYGYWILFVLGVPAAELTS